MSYNAVSTIALSDYHYGVALGRINGAVTWNLFGYNADVDSAAPEAVFANGGTFTRINTASTFTIVSSSIEDTNLTGTGAWNLVVYYLDANRVAQIGVVPLNGTNNVVSSFSGLGINRAALYNTGSGDVNAGNITITATTGGSIQSYVPAGEGTSQNLLFFTQTGHTTLADFLLINVGKLVGGAAPKVTIRGWVYSYVSTAKYLIFNHTVDTSVENTISLIPEQPFVIGEKSILWFEITTNTNDTIVNMRLSLIEVNS